MNDKERIRVLEAAIRWALGEIDDFRERKQGEGAYWWRTELRRRALLQQAPGKAQIDRDCGYPFTACNSAKKHAKDCPSYSQPVEAKLIKMDMERCELCNWPLAESVEKGCVPGNCSMRPVPTCPAPAEKRSEKLYYAENVERGVVGNCLLWWRIDGHGYTCDIKDAQKFSEAEALKLVEGRKKYRIWPVEEIDAIAKSHVDMQDVCRIRAERGEK